ncbi:MAG: 16S rRNA (adenine(1518)-N(6)/adenine(1519)-N(6))-dimethyltransferase RsmA [Propionibacteriaceae bacterium]|jgi:16S rRNA (adenine1518-N6/adenine1519-N6)-dimethyltransferase|nr:16S rRNA (adenine(1518)-N(6)/adenine(1519)-N(6))-dimethyltransferase RsmA [Propionibacteriaceae bacterium]
MTDGLLDATTVRRWAAQAGLRPSKRRGQNFVIDANTVRRIVQAAEIGPDDVVLEIGPGLGSLTVGLLGPAAAVVAVEIEPILAQRLPQAMAERRPDRADRLTVLAADALDLTDLPGPPPTLLVANLPYNVAVPVLLRTLAGFPSLRAGLVMVQLEVAERLTARPGSKAYGVPSVKLAWHAQASRLGLVPASVFWPRPQVESGLVRWRRQPPPATTASRPEVFAVIDAAFAQRRKMLRSALSARWPQPQVEAALAQAGVDPTARGETLDVAQYARLAAALGPAESGSPGRNRSLDDPPLSDRAVAPRDTPEQ